ncbi:MAG: glycosyltransferase [Candidatus Cloacimonetes bacterium]|nr:glycosyltransferase [Candidatus Cloacimonadota bacterium]
MKFLFLLIPLVTLIIYKRYINIFCKGLRISDKIYNPNKYKVSVIVAAHNEEENIHRLLTALVNQTYSQDLYEVIIANDDSIDDTAEIVEKFAAKWHNVILLNVTGRNLVKSPKKNALQQAIELSRGEIILTTDADCLVTTKWIESIVACFSDNVDMVVGFSKTDTKWHSSSLVEKFEFFDFAVMYGVVAGAISKGKYFSCIGQNLAYKKEMFIKVGGFKRIKHLLSGDDVNLMQLFRKEGAKVVFSFSKSSFAQTKSVQSWLQLLNQRSRWASNLKFQLKLNPEFFAYLNSVIILVISILIAFAVDWRAALFLLFLKTFFEYKYVVTVFNTFDIDKRIMSFFPIWLLIQPIFGLLTAIAGQVNLFKWKGRKQN